MLSLAESKHKVYRNISNQSHHSLNLQSPNNPPKTCATSKNLQQRIFMLSPKQQEYSVINNQIYHTINHPTNSNPNQKETIVYPNFSSLKSLHHEHRYPRLRFQRNPQTDILIFLICLRLLSLIPSFPFSTSSSNSLPCSLQLLTSLLLTFSQPLTSTTPYSPKIPAVYT